MKDPPSLLLVPAELGPRDGLPFAGLAGYRTQSPYNSTVCLYLQQGLKEACVQEEAVLVVLHRKNNDLDDLLIKTSPPLEHQGQGKNRASLPWPCSAAL